MDHVRIEEENVVERYLMRQLDPADAERFEQHYLDCPECLDKLEIVKRLHQGLKAVATEAGTSLARTAFVAWLLRRGRTLQAGLAVAIVALAVLPWAFFGGEVSRLSGEHERLAAELARTLSPQIRTPTYVLSPERSGPEEEPSTRITLGPTPEWVALALQLPPSQSPATCRVRLREAEGETLWESGPIEPDVSGRVTLSVHASWLEASSYVVELDALAPGGESQPVARFTFGVRNSN